MAGKIRTYKKETLTIYWKPDICIHSENCVNGHGGVFNPESKPWINVDAASAKEIMDVIDKCPSQALSYTWKDAEKPQDEPAQTSDPVEISMLKNGPFIVKGNFILLDSALQTVETGEKVALCRCGASKNKPFCDGAHKEIDFQG